MKETKSAEKGEGGLPRVDWQTWASCLSQSRIDAIGRKTGFRVGETFNPERSAQFNEAVNEARAKKLGII